MNTSRRRRTKRTKYKVIYQTLSPRSFHVPSFTGFLFVSLQRSWKEERGCAKEPHDYQVKPLVASRLHKDS
jgi:hypothetical protein